MTRCVPCDYAMSALEFLDLLVKQAMIGCQPRQQDQSGFANGRVPGDIIAISPIMDCTLVCLERFLFHGLPLWSAGLIALQQDMTCRQVLTRAVHT